jgi:hypothetical protein
VDGRFVPLGSVTGGAVSRRNSGFWGVSEPSSGPDSSQSGSFGGSVPCYAHGA